MLYKKDKWYFYSLFVGAVLLGSFCEFKPKPELYSDLITFISILIGFQITSFSMIFTSNVVKNFYTIKDIENKYITLKHRLKNYYKFTFNLALISIVFIFALSMFNFNQISTRWGNISMYWLNRTIIFSIIALNIFANFKTMNFLYKIFIKDNDKNEH